MTGDLLQLMREKQFELQPRSVPATITPPSADPIETRIIWLAPITNDVPAGFDHTYAEARRVVAIAKSDLSAVPLKTRIDAPEHPGDEIRIWRVDGIERYEPDHTRVMLIPEREIES